MEASKRILIAIDDSEASDRAVAYVGRVIGGKRGFKVRLTHVLPPIPPQLLEVGGSENPELERQMEADVHDAQAKWLEAAEKEAESLFKRAKTILRRARILMRDVELQCCTSVSGEGVVSNILDDAQQHTCGTVVVGREIFSGWQKRFNHHVGDELIRKAQDFTIWVVV